MMFSALLLTGMSGHSVCLNGHPSVADEYKNAKAVAVARVEQKAARPVQRRQLASTHSKQDSESGETG